MGINALAFAPIDYRRNLLFFSFYDKITFLEANGKIFGCILENKGALFEKNNKR
jgi:hypothetical protein